MRRDACDGVLPFACLRASRPHRRHIQIGAALASQSIKILIKARMTVASCHYEFIKRYLTRVFARGAVDVTAKSVYVAARNLVFGLSLLLRSRLRAAPQVNSQNFGL